MGMLIDMSLHGDVNHGNANVTTIVCTVLMSSGTSQNNFDSLI